MGVGDRGGGGDLGGDFKDSGPCWDLQEIKTNT